MSEPASPAGVDGPAVPSRAGRTRPVAASGLGVKIGDTQILRGLELAVASGEVVGITGRNGTGKSTLLRVLATLLPPGTGSLQLFGVETASRRGVPLALRRRLCLVGHEPALHPHRTVGEELGTMAVIADSSRSVADALALVGLTGAAQRQLGACSQGMRRRADLARAWLCAPRLLLLDEPDAGLDPGAAAVVTSLVADVHSREGAVVVVGHDRDRLDAVCDRVWTLTAGRLRPVP